jgi:hypothetical protein
MATVLHLQLERAKRKPKPSFDEIDAGALCIAGMGILAVIGVVIGFVRWAVSWI